MKRLAEKEIAIYPVIITDCSDPSDISFFESFAKDKRQIYQIKRSGLALSALLCIVPL
jgi:hypothetical protein